MMTAGSKTHEYFIQRLMDEGTYNRFQTIFEESVAMDKIGASDLLFL